MTKIVLRYVIFLQRMLETTDGRSYLLYKRFKYDFINKI